MKANTGQKYDDYLRLQELLALQGTHASPPDRDELLFVVQHQVTELWLKLLINEINYVMRCLRADGLPGALTAMARIREIQRNLADQWSVVETLAPEDFARFRSSLRPASGLESEQHRTVEFLLGDRDWRWLTHRSLTEGARRRLRAIASSPSLFDEFIRLLHRRGIPLPSCCLRQQDHAVPRPCRLLSQALHEIHLSRDELPAEYRMCQELVDMEERLQLWRFRHLSTVRRVIGYAAGTGGSTGVRYLASRLDRSCFPELLEARTMGADSGGQHPTDARCPLPEVEESHR